MEPLLKATLALFYDDRILLTDAMARTIVTSNTSSSLLSTWYFLMQRIAYPRVFSKGSAELTLSDFHIRNE